MPLAIVESNETGVCVGREVRHPSKPLLQKKTSILCAEFLSCHKHTPVSSHINTTRQTDITSPRDPLSLYGNLTGAFCHKFFTLRLHIQVPAASGVAQEYFKQLNTLHTLVLVSANHFVDSSQAFLHDVKMSGLQCSS